MVRLAVAIWFKILGWTWVYAKSSNGSVETAMEILSTTLP